MVEDLHYGPNALLTLIEREIRYVMLKNHVHDTVDYAMNKLRLDFSEIFPQVI